MREKMMFVLLIIVDNEWVGGNLQNSETLENLCKTLGHLPYERAKQLEDLILEYGCLFSDVPGRTHLVEHDIELEKTDPIRQTFCRVNQEKKKALDAEVAYLMKSNMAEPSRSSILVPKKDKTV